MEKPRLIGWLEVEPRCEVWECDREFNKDATHWDFGPGWTTRASTLAGGGTMTAVTTRAAPAVRDLPEFTPNGPPGETPDRLRAEGAVYCGEWQGRRWWSHDSVAALRQAVPGNVYQWAGRDTTPILDSDGQDLGIPTKCAEGMRERGLLPQVPGKAVDPGVKQVDGYCADNIPPEQPTYPGLTYVGTAYGCKVYVGEWNWSDPEEGFCVWSHVSVGEAFRHSLTSGHYASLADHDNEITHRRGLVVTSNVLRWMEGWIDDWQEWIPPEDRGDRAPTVNMTDANGNGRREPPAAPPRARPQFSEHIDPEPYEPQLLWGKPQIPDDRSADLLEVVDGRVVLFLEESETHTGVGAWDEDQWSSARACVEDLKYCAPAGLEDHCDALTDAINAADDQHADRWPVDLTAIRDAAERLNLALSWKANGTRPASAQELDASYVSRAPGGTRLPAYRTDVPDQAREKLASHITRTGRLFLHSTRKASPWSPYEGE